jgi:hypothetical protein
MLVLGVKYEPTVQFSYAHILHLHKMWAHYASSYLKFIYAIPPKTFGGGILIKLCTIKDVDV